MAVLRSIDGYSPAAIRRTWIAMFRWAKSRDLWHHTRKLGVLRSNPLVTDPKRCFYYVAIVIPEGFAQEVGAGTSTVRNVESPANTYALYRYRIPKRSVSEPEIVAVYLRFYHCWMREAGMEPFHLRSIEIPPPEFPLLNWRNKVLTIGIPVRPARVF